VGNIGMEKQDAKSISSMWNGGKMGGGVQFQGSAAREMQEKPTRWTAQQVRPPDIFSFSFLSFLGTKRGTCRSLVIAMVCCELGRSKKIKWPKCVHWAGQVLGKCCLYLLFRAWKIYDCYDLFFFWCKCEVFIYIGSKPCSNIIFCHFSLSNCELHFFKNSEYCDRKKIIRGKKFYW